MNVPIRRLWPFDLPALARHLIRLDEETRQLRFGASVSDAFLKGHAQEALCGEGWVYAVFEAGEIVASVELRPIMHEGLRMAEIAFAVEAPHQHRGLGSALMDRALLAARNRLLFHVCMICLPKNLAVRQLAQKFGARVHISEGEIIGELAPTAPSPFSLAEENLLDATAFVRTFLDRQLALLRPV